MLKTNTQTGLKTIMKYSWSPIPNLAHWFRWLVTTQLQQGQMKTNIKELKIYTLDLQLKLFDRQHSYFMKRTLNRKP